MRRIRSFNCSLVFWLLAVLAAAVAAEPPRKAGELFQTEKVWTVHLTFSADQWEAMEPKGGMRGMFGGGARPGGGGVAGPPGGFGPGNFLAPALLAQADGDKDAKVSKAEWTELGERWFTAWDKTGAGKLNAEQLRAGLDSAFGPPTNAAGPPRGMAAFNLQGPEGKRNGLASAMGVEFTYVRGDLEFEGRTLKDVAVRYKGNGTWLQSQGSLKRSFKVDTNEHVKGQDLSGVTKINLHSNVTDAGMMNEVLSHRLFRDAGVPAPRTAYARVYVSVPGKHERRYLGLYSLVEAVDKDFTKDRFDTKGGALFKPVTPTLFTDLGDAWAKYNQTYDPKTELAGEQARRVIDFCKLVSHADDAQFEAKVGEFLDLEAFARFMAVTVWLPTLDSILSAGQNYYVYLDPRTSRFQFIPWDLDHSFGQFFLMGSPEQREQLSIHRPWMGQNRFLERVFKVEAFKRAYLTRLAEFTGTIFKPERIRKQVDEVAAAIREAVREESTAKFERFEKVVAGEAVGPEIPGPPGGGGAGAGAGAGPGPRGFGGFMPAVKSIKSFVPLRAQSVIEQLAQKSQGQTIAGFGFGPPPGGGGGRAGPGRPAPGGPEPGRRFGPGMFLQPAFVSAMDLDKDAHVTRAEFVGAFERWFDSWDVQKSGAIGEEQLRNGMNKDFAFRPGASPPPPPAPQK